MIEGLKITIKGVELQTLCNARAQYHRDRALAYGAQEVSMEANQIEGMEYSNGDPKKVLRDKRHEHDSEAAELTFIAEHVAVTEDYLLDRGDLAKLGISKSRW